MNTFEISAFLRRCGFFIYLFGKSKRQFFLRTWYTMEYFSEFSAVVEFFWQKI